MGLSEAGKCMLRVEVVPNRAGWSEPLRNLEAGLPFLDVLKMTPLYEVTCFPPVNIIQGTCHSVGQ